MKKGANMYSVMNIILVVVLVLLIIGVVYLWTLHSNLRKEFEEEKNREKRVYFIEEQIEMIRQEPEEFCRQICEDRNYDGFVEGIIAKEGTSFFTYECSCYRIVI